jgi:hypothetical protein
VKTTPRIRGSVSGRWTSKTTVAQKRADPRIEDLSREFRKQGLPTLAAGFETSNLSAKALLRFLRSLISAFGHGARGVWNNKGDIVVSAAGQTAVVFAILLFSFATSEVWEFFAKIGQARFAVVLAVFVVLGLVILLMTLDRQLGEVFRVSTRRSAKELRELGGERAVALSKDFPVPDDRRDTPFRLNWRQQMNVRIVLFSPLFTIFALVGLFSFLFFVGLGVALVDEPLTKTLTTGSPYSPRAHAAGGFIVTEPLLRVAAFLSVVAAFAFAIEVLTKRELKEDLINEDCKNVKRLVALWVFYKAAIDRSGQASPSPQTSPSQASSP